MENGILRSLQEIIFPRYCLLCHKKISSKDSNDLVCAECIETITLNTPPFCQKCGRQIQGKYTTKNICKGCIHTHFYFDRAWASCRYDDSLREMIHNFKYRNKTGLKKHLSGLLINFAKNYYLPISHCDYAIPIPLSPSKLREREFNQAQILANDIAGHFGLSLMVNNLKRIRNTQSQTELEEKLRWQNIQGAFSLKEPNLIREKIILLVDDVLTSGATVSEAAKTLKEAGASAVFVLTIAN